MTVYPQAGNNPMDLFAILQASDDWKYSTWEKRDLVRFSPVKAHYALSYTRYRSDDSLIGVYESLYVLSLTEGRWGILARSSFGP